MDLQVLPLPQLLDHSICIALILYYQLETITVFHGYLLSRAR